MAIIPCATDEEVEQPGSNGDHNERLWFGMLSMSLQLPLVHTKPDAVLPVSE